MRIPSKLIALLSSCVATALAAQTVKVVPFKDSALLITRAPACTSACPDSVRLEWRYGGQYVTRKWRVARGSDTTRIARVADSSAYTDSAVLVYTPLPQANKPVRLGLIIAPIEIPTSNGAGSATNVRAPKPTAVPPYAATGPYTLPKPPATFSTAYPKLSGRVRRVRNGDDLQRVLNDAQPGDEVVLENGSKFSGNYTLPKKAGTDWIVIRGETVAAPLGTRIDPKLMSTAARVETPNSSPAFFAAPGAARWRLVGFEVAHATGAPEDYGIVVLGSGSEPTIADLPSDIVLDRMYVHGSTTDGTRRCVAFNGARLAVIQSALLECHALGSDAQGICGWAGPGPFIIEDNRIEGSGQAIMFGGADPFIRNVSPSDIIIRRNYFFKPLSWAHHKWSVKAAFELKHAKRVLFESNVIENHWTDEQVGIAILFQSVSQSNHALEWTVVQDVMVRNNILRNSAGGVNVLARLNHDGKVLVNGTERVLFINNWFDNVGRDPITGDGNLIVQALTDLVDFTFTENTITLLAGRAEKLVSFDGGPVQIRTTITENIFPAAQYGVTGRGTVGGTPTLNANMPGGVFQQNVMPGQDPAPFPAGAISRTARGANIAAVNAATAGVVK
ncbi:MAG: hypothetical protein ABJB74_13735 [Gemmatimonas sp.]